MNDNLKKLCFIGAGNLATHLAKALHGSGFTILQVYSRTESSAKMLATQINAGYTAVSSEITDKADIYFVALKDSAITGVLSGIDFQNKLLVHTSGSVPLSALASYSNNIGVLYPLQTFSKNRAVDFADIPVFIEANSASNEKILNDITVKISSKVSVLNSEKRKSLHIAAVFACNFVNHLYNLAAGYLEMQDISYEVLIPLIKETAKKVQEMPPELAQTGPAVRFDKNIINDHLESLQQHPELKALYNSISRSIFEHHQKK